MAGINIVGLQKKFGGSLAVSDFSLQVADGELVAFLGPSGCGKTTTLRMIAGFIDPSAGQIFIGDQDVTHLPVHKRNTGMVFQKYALFPHMTVAENVAFGLKMRKQASGDIDTRMHKALSMVRMEKYKDRYPRQLSGGQQQRVALARALVIEPKVFLLDEPLSNLDAKLRVEVREEIRALQQDLALTTVFVTHDQEEALAISDRMAIMNGGRIQQIGDPRTLYEKPANYFVADFLGKMNFLEGKKSADGFRTTSGLTLGLPVDAGTRRIGIRPENIYLARQQRDGAVNLRATVVSLSYLGSVVEVKSSMADGTGFYSTMSNRELGEMPELEPGREIFLHFHPRDANLFDEA